VLALAAVAAVAVGLTGASGATGHYGQFRMIPGGTVTANGSSQVPLALSNKPATYILEMSAKPVAAVDAAHKAAGRGPLSSSQRSALAQRIRSQQAPVIAAVRQMHGASVGSRYHGVYNGISVTLPQREAYRLSSISGVKAVFATQSYKVATAPGDGIPLVRAPDTWGGLGAYTGAGIKIADIDTGVDYTHADFGGSGNPADYNCAHAAETQDPSTISCNGHTMDEYIGPNAPKVKGGIDLVGDAYNADPNSNSYNPVPTPDNNPLDCNGHGTHTAGTMAGLGVDNNGNTYGGPYDKDTINNSFTSATAIPPGVAPQADLYGVRVFGCSGSVNDDVLIAAMDWSFNNGMDVVNMSLGASFGDPTNPDSVAADNLAKEGVITVLSAGNSGRNPYLVGSPSVGISALSVAANDSTEEFPGATLDLTKADTTSGGSLTAIDANGWPISGGTYSLKVIWANSPTNTVISNGCRNPSTGENPDGADNSLPPNTIIVVARGTCARVAKAIFGQQAGAAGVIMVNNSTLYPPYEGPITNDPDAPGPPLWGGFQYNVTIPFLGVKGGSVPSNSAAGVALRAADGGTVTLTGTTVPNSGYLALASFTSYGPTAGGILKPEVTAPGVSILSAGVGQGTAGAFLSGTSMAAPHTTGTAALVKQAHPNWGSVNLWKAAIVNTANPSLVASYNIRGAGAGEIDAFNATHTNVVALGDPDGTASLSFGVQDVPKKFDLTKKITLQNLGGSPVTFAVSHTTKQGVPHKVIVTTPNSNAPLKVRVPAHGSATVTVELIVYQGNSDDPVTAFNDWWGAAQFDDAAGLIHFAPVSGGNHGISLNVPYYAVPTAVSKVAISGISQAALKNGATDSNVVLTNPHAAPGYADWFSWGGSSSVSPSDIGAADLLNDGIQSFPNAGLFEFALQTSKSWTNPAEETVEVDIDVNNDNTPDYAILSYDHGSWTAGSIDGEAVVVAYNLHTGRNAIHYLTGAMFNGTTMELPVLFTDLCTSGAPCVTDGTPITYDVFMTDRNGGSDQITNNKPFDIYHPSLSTANGSSDFVPRSGTVSDPVTINQAAWNANPQLGILVLMQNNQNTVGEAKTFSLSF
jgi:subtilisin family serine protease